MNELVFYIIMSVVNGANLVEVVGDSQKACLQAQAKEGRAYVARVNLKTGDMKTKKLNCKIKIESTEEK